jgi:predicted RNA-binding protein with TRAM domain
MMNKRLIKTLIVMVALTVLASAASAEGLKKRVRFPRGSTSTVLKGGVIRGERDAYIVGARAGQTMTVRITSVEDNAVFQIYKPGGKVTLEGAGESQDATRWSGKLPASGDYTIFVGGTRGNASYKIEIKIE